MGKTALARNIQGLLGCDTILTGEILRKKFPFEKEIPDHIVFRLISESIAKRTTNICIIDNFPYSEKQFHTWETCFKPPTIVFKIIGKHRPRVTRDDSYTHFAIRKLKFDKEISPILEFLSKKGLIFELENISSERKLLEKAYQIIRTVLIQSQKIYSDNAFLAVEKLSIRAKLPEKQYPFSAGYDVYLLNSIELEPYKTGTFSTGISVEIPARCVGILTARSSTSIKGILVHNGVIDPAFDGEIKVILTNLTNKTIKLDSLIAIAQLLFIKIYCPIFTEIRTLKTNRTGFGSSNNGTFFESI